MKNRVVVIGSYNCDMIIKTKRIPQPGETIIGGQFSLAAGGKGANQAVAAARAGAQVWFIGRVGSDVFGREALANLKQNNINIDYVTQDEHTPTGVASIIVDEVGENSIVVASGANANLSPQDVRKAEAVIARANVALLQLEISIDTVAAAIHLAVAHSVPVILNPAPARDIPDDLLSKISLLTPNEVEAEMLTGIAIDTDKQLEQVAAMMLAKGVGRMLITLGKNGVYYADKDSQLRLRAYEVNAVDTTGAGDVFSGALAAFYHTNTIEEALRLASAAAAISVTRIGAQNSAPYLAEIYDFIKKYQNPNTFIWNL